MVRTNLTVKNDKLWKWAKMRAIELDCNSVSEYIFNLIETDKQNKIKNRK